MDENQEQRPQSMLPYEDWAEEARRQVAVRALEHIAREGLPGEHHFYVTFRTDHPGVIIPQRLRAQYPQEMTIVLQHQFWDLKVDAEGFQVGLSFGGVPASLTIPFAALAGFADPYVQFGLRFRPPPAAPQPEVAQAPPTQPEPQEGPAPEPGEVPQVVSLDAFRRRPTPKD
ncbi:MAG: hypothetical protein JO264_03820 [Acidisphaera sp.]|nr:hypothetical protein [Acidisphaera sp.]